MAGGYVSTSIDSIEVRPGDESQGDSDFRALRVELGIEAFGITSWLAGPGKRLIQEHSEDGGDEELYLVLSGQAVFTVDGETVTLGPGGCVAIKPGVTRSAVAGGEATEVLVVGAPVGGAYVPSGWEHMRDAMSLYRAGNYPGALAAMDGPMERHPDSPVMVYNRGCFEALTGDREAALDDVARALEMRPQLRELAQTDSDLDSIRDDPRFPAATA